jgi:glycosyltransferase involved in cell wall biosynthesis
MRLGTGVKNKVLEAWAAGRPVVLTPLAANGLELDDAMRAWVTKRWETFGILLVQLLSDPRLRESLGSAALSWVRARHSWAASGATLSQLLRAVSAPRIV